MSDNKNLLSPEDILHLNLICYLKLNLKFEPDETFDLYKSQKYYHNKPFYRNEPLHTFEPILEDMAHKGYIKFEPIYLKHPLNHPLFDCSIKIRPAGGLFFIRNLGIFPLVQ